MNTLDNIKTQVDKLARKINAPQALLPTYGTSTDGGHPHVEIDEKGNLFYVIVERGQVMKRYQALDIDDLLYTIFLSITFNLASQQELNQRRQNEDSRRQIFNIQESLLEQLKLDWKFRIKEYHNGIINLHPFNDKL
jgi:hypothetical protein